MKIKQKTYTCHIARLLYMVPRGFHRFDDCFITTGALSALNPIDFIITGEEK